LAEPTADNAELLSSLASGQTAALAELYDRYAALAFSLALRMLGNQAEAEDAVQESFLTLWRSAALYNGERGSESAWLLRIVRHRCIDHLRHRARSPQSAGSAVLPDLPARSDVCADVLHHLSAEEIRHALLHLSPEQRETIKLAYFRGWTHAEIASRLDLPLGTVKGRMRLALRRLRELLVQQEATL
jgi:RNA polymerase sigma-70 factor (ECF subfamily)